MTEFMRARKTAEAHNFVVITCLVIIKSQVVICAILFDRWKPTWKELTTPSKKNNLNFRVEQVIRTNSVETHHMKKY